MTRKYARQIIQGAHDAGLQIVTYLQPFTMGRRSLEMFRKHPDWFAYDKFGQPLIGYGEEALAELRNNRIEKYLPGGMAGAINFTNKQALDAAIDQIVACAKLYRFDGIRFDNTCYDVKTDQYDWRGNPLAKTQQEADEKTRFALDHLRDRLTREISPKFLVGHNFGHPARDVHPAAWDRIASNGWVVMDEITGPTLSATDPKSPSGIAPRPWKDLIGILRSARDATWKLSGHYQMIQVYTKDIETPNPQDPKHPTFTAAEPSWYYQHIFAQACGVHPVIDPPYGRIKGFDRFAARYAALLFDNTMRPVGKPESTMAVQSAREVWWKNFVTLRQGDQGQIQTIMHLINPPPYPMYAYRKNELPAPVESVSVQTTIPKDCTFTRAVLLRPDAQEPLTQTVLDAKIEVGRITVVVPRVELWSVVVFEWKPKDAKVFATLAPPQEDTSKQVDLNPAARQAWIDSTQVKEGTGKMAVTDAGLFLGRVETAEKAVDPDTRSGFALKACKGVTKEWYMATGTFSTFERFGKYRITFRIKCSDNTVKDNVVNIGTVSEGGSPFENVGRPLKGTDFAASNKYQNISLEVLRGDSGNFAYIMTYAGHADVAVDTITSERIGDTTDQELVEKMGAQGLKIVAKPLGAKPAKVLWVQGLFYREDPFAGAMNESKIPFQAVAVDSGSVLHNFPKSWDEIAQYTMLLLTDTDPRGLGFTGRALVKAWVEQGGTLIVTGGPYAFGKGLTKGTVLGDIYPIEALPWDLIPGGTFSATNATPSGCPIYNGTSGSYYIHRTTVKQGAHVVLRCKDRPVLAYQKVGLGKVVVFTGTALENDGKVKPFWTDPAWSQWSARFLQSMVR